MKVIGVDFTSSPSTRKPITYTKCELNNTSLSHVSSGQIENFEEFEGFLDNPGPWIAGFDFPFGQPRRLLENLGWNPDWESYVTAISLLGKKGWDEFLKSYRDGRPKGDKQHLRVTDRIAGSRSSMMMYGVPVGKMFFEGAPRLMKSGISIIPCRPNNSDRIAIEAYPALVARRWAIKSGYKNDQKSKRTPEQKIARKLIVDGLIAESVRLYGMKVLVEDNVKESMVDDASGDTLDGLLCAVQAAWAYLQPGGGMGIPVDVDSDEGWIVDNLGI